MALETSTKKLQSVHMQLTCDSSKRQNLQYLITLQRSLGKTLLRVPRKSSPGQKQSPSLNFPKRLILVDSFGYHFLYLLSVVYRICTFYQTSASVKALSCLISALITSSYPTLPGTTCQEDLQVVNGKLRIFKVCPHGTTKAEMCFVHI